MAKDKTIKELKTEKLAQIFCSSFYISRYSNEKLSVKELSADVYKILEKYDTQFEDSIKEFDGYSYEETTSKKFKQRRTNIENKLEREIDEVLKTIPFPIKDESENDKKPYQADENFKFPIESEIVDKWLEKYSAMGGQSEYERECYKFEDEDLKSIVSKLRDAGKYTIKDKAMQKVVDDAAQEGKYKFYKKFEDVPKACKYFDKILGDKVTRAAIKKKIKTYARIIENGEELKWKVINKRVNAWVAHESNRYNRDKIPNK
jgi:hypothetical protein